MRTLWQQKPHHLTTSPYLWLERAENAWIREEKAQRANAALSLLHGRELVAIAHQDKLDPEPERKVQPHEDLWARTV